MFDTFYPASNATRPVVESVLTLVAELREV